MQYYIDWLGKSWSLLQLYPGQIHKLAAFYLCKVKTTPLAQRALLAEAENVLISKKKKKEYNVPATAKPLICRFPIKGEILHKANTGSISPTTFLLNTGVDNWSIPLLVENGVRGHSQVQGITQWDLRLKIKNPNNEKLKDSSKKTGVELVMSYWQDGKR